MAKESNWSEKIAIFVTDRTGARTSAGAQLFGQLLPVRAQVHAQVTGQVLGQVRLIRQICREHLTLDKEASETQHAGETCISVMSGSRMLISRFSQTTSKVVSDTFWLFLGL